MGGGPILHIGGLDGDSGVNMSGTAMSSHILAKPVPVRRPSEKSIAQAKASINNSSVTTTTFNCSMATTLSNTFMGTPLNVPIGTSSDKYDDMLAGLPTMDQAFGMFEFSPVFTSLNQSCEKVMFSQASVCS